MSLREYTRKRDFRKTSEPSTQSGAKQSGHRRFVVQKHAASRLHYDFRIELSGRLKSWAVPKGFPFQKGEKRLAVQVEDHPSSYIDFEGNIPTGQYGGGTVMVWDTGTVQPLGHAPLKDLKSGKLHFILEGTKLQGEWYLVRLKDEEQWLLIRGGETVRPPSKKQDDTSVLSGRSMKQISATKEIPPAHRKNSPKGSNAVPAFVDPMKARLADKPPAGNTGDWIYEIKFDGWRALALLGEKESRLVSRNQKDFSDKFPEIMESLKALKLRDTILDGEIVALNDKGVSSFQLLQAYDIDEERPDLFFYVFDILRLKGKDLRTQPLLERKKILGTLLKKSSTALRFSAALGTNAEALMKQVRRLGLEGLIGKRADSTYETGRRSGSWIKLKLHTEQEFVIGGITEPQGTRKHFGALVVGTHEDGELRCAGKVGTGFNAKLLKVLSLEFDKIRQKTCPFTDLPDKGSGRWGQGITTAEMKKCTWLKPQLVCQVKFNEWTRDGRLRQPVFLGLRKDKKAAEVVRENS